jgi:hypothetical protein
MLHRFEFTSEQVRILMTCIDMAQADFDEEAFEVSNALFRRLGIEAERARQQRETK